MVVSLEPGNVRGWGILAGGQSGNPGSANYDYDVNRWVEGKYHEFVFMSTAEAQPSRVVARTKLRGTK